MEAAIAASAGGPDARAMVRAVGRVPDPAAAEVLVRMLGHRHASVRAGAATALIARDARLDPAAAEKEIRAEVAVAGHALRALAAFGAVDPNAPDELGLVVDTLWDGVRAARDQVLRVLSLCHDPVALRAIRRVLADGDDRSRAYALEVARHDPAPNPEALCSAVGRALRAGGRGRRATPPVRRHRAARSRAPKR